MKKNGDLYRLILRNIRRHSHITPVLRGNCRECRKVMNAVYARLEGR